MATDIPAIGSAWQHRSGRTYTVLHIANVPDNRDYPLTIVYRDTDGNVWARWADDWHRTMTLWPEPPS